VGWGEENETTKLSTLDGSSYHDDDDDDVVAFYFFYYFILLSRNAERWNEKVFWKFRKFGFHGEAAEEEIPKASYLLNENYDQNVSDDY
jgi:hypothetical protein